MLTTVIPCVVILVLGFVTWNRSNTWSDIRNLADDSVRHHPGSPRANDFAARVALSHERNISKAIGYVMAGARAAPHEVGFHIDMRILLAILSSEISASLTEKSKAMLKEKAGIKIEGVPDGIRSTVNEDGVSLVYEPSSRKAISELLRDRPISVHAIVSIENLHRCLLEKPYPCSPFKFEALEWLIAAGDNPKTSADYRALILSNTARIYASLHDYPHAYEYIDRATRLLPEKLSYQLGRIEYLIKLGRLDEARKLLDVHAERLAKPDAELTANRDTILLLEDMYKNASSGGQSRIGRH
jgi:tetratricopeptide (TPR) repeat protein